MARADGLHLSLDLIVVGLGVRDHKVKGQDGVAVSDARELFSLLAHVT